MSRSSCLVAILLAAAGCAAQQPPPAPPVASINTLEQAMAAVAGKLAPKTKTVIAVFPFPERGIGATLLGEFVAEKLMVAMTAQDGLELVERGRLDTVRKEQVLGISGELDDSTAASVGNLAGASSVVVGTLTDLGGGIWELSARLLGASDARIQTAAESKFAAGTLPPGLAGKKIGEPLAQAAQDRAPAPAESEPAAKAELASAPPPSCSGLEPWVVYVGAEEKFKPLGRQSYLEVSWKFGKANWVAIEIDGRQLRVCGEKQTVTDAGHTVELAPPQSEAFILIEDPNKTHELKRRCFGYNEGTKQFYPVAGAHVEQVKGGYKKLIAPRRCSP